MKQNIKIAKQLIKLAKELTATNPDENISDLSYYNTIKREMQEFLEYLDQYLKLRSYFFRVINSNDNTELIKIKGKIASVLQENSKFKYLSTQELVSEINSLIKESQGKLNGTNKGQNDLGFQRLIGSLIETKRTFLYATNINGKSSIQIEENAKYLMSRIAHILHNQRQLLINSQNGQMVTDELIMLYDFLNEKGIQLVTSLSKQPGYKNYADNALTHVNVERARNNFRIRIKQESENLIKFANLLNSFVNLFISDDIKIDEIKIDEIKIDDIRSDEIKSDDIKNERFTLVRRIGESISTCQEMMMGYFTTINTLTLSAMKFNRKSKGLIELDKDIPEDESQQYSEIEQIFNIDKDEFKYMLDKIEEMLRKKGPTNGFHLIEKNPSILFKDQSKYQSLSSDSIQKLLEYLDSYRKDIKNFIKRKQRHSSIINSSEQQEITAGFIDNVKNFFQSAIDKIKDITFNVRETFVNFLKKFNTQIDVMEKDFNKLDVIIEKDNKLTKQQIDMMKRINEMDQSLINFFNEIKNK